MPAALDLLRCPEEPLGRSFESDENRAEPTRQAPNAPVSKSSRSIQMSMQDADVNFRHRLSDRHLTWTAAVRTIGSSAATPGERDDEPAGVEISSSPQRLPAGAS
jgi:hypothetical protein